MNQINLKLKSVNKALVLFFCLLLLCSCASTSQKNTKLAQQSLASKNYDAAFDQTYRALTEDIKNKEAIKIFPEVFDNIQRYHNDNIIKAKQSNSWDTVSNEYDRLFAVNENASEIIKLINDNYKEQLTDDKQKKGIFSSITSAFSVPKEDLVKISNLQVQNISEEKDIAHQKASTRHYQEGQKLAGEKKYREASNEFNRALTFVANFKDAQSLKNKYKKMADEKDAQQHYQEGQRLAGQKRYREASNEFNRALSFVSNYKDAQSLENKYKKMADEKDAKKHYQEGKRLMQQKKYSLAYDEFVKANEYVYAYENVLDLIEESKNKMPPSEQEIIKAVERCLSRDGVPVSWVGNLMGGGKTTLSSISIERIGIFNESKQYWPMIIRVQGSSLLNDPFNKGKRVDFDRNGDFVLYRDDYGDWQASLKGGMFQ